MSLRLLALAPLVLTAALAAPAHAQRTGGLTVGASVETQRAFDRTLAVPGVSIGYASARGLRAEIGADFVGRARRRYRSGPGDLVKRHARLAGSLAYALPLGERAEVDLGLRGRLSLAAQIEACGGTDSCDRYEGYAAIGPAAGATVLVGRFALRAGGGVAWSSVDDVFGGPWVRLGLQVRR